MSTPTKPQHWFRALSEADELQSEPEAIEYLRMWTGETFIHVFGTAYWVQDVDGIGYLDQKALMHAGITHWRIPSHLPKPR